jgi:hypothetical protein
MPAWNAPLQKRRVNTWRSPTTTAGFTVSLPLKRIPPIARDSDGDGMNDLQEFQLGLQPGKKDNPAVGLVVFTPLEK